MRLKLLLVLLAVVVAGLSGDAWRRHRKMAAAAVLQPAGRGSGTSAAVPTRQPGSEPTDAEVLEASLRRLESARHEADVLAMAAAPGDAGTPLPPELRTAPQDGAPAEDGRDALGELLRQGKLDAALGQVDAQFRAHAPSAVSLLGMLTRDLLARLYAGQLREVEGVAERLQALPTSDPAVRAPVAVVLGEVAAALLRTQDFERARRMARATRELDDTNSAAFLVLGELEYQGNDPDAALDAWDRGLRLHPDDRRLAIRIAQVRRERPLVHTLSRQGSSHFVISFEGGEDLEAARKTLETLEDAYRQVGALFLLYPDEPIPVVLYPHRTFSQRAGHVSWSAGEYDGKIRIPSEGALGQGLRYRGTLFHEYAHALFHRATRGAPAPAWLNEGMAQLAGLRADPIPPVGCAMGHGYPLEQLQNSFGRLDRGTAYFAYLGARHAMEQLRDRYGDEQIRALLRALAEKPDFSRGFESTFGQPFDAYARAFDKEASP